MLTAPELRIRSAGSVDWGPDLPAETRPADPDPGAGALLQPGFSPPLRPRLELACAASGLAGRVAGSHSELPLALRFTSDRSERIGLAAPPLGVAARDDGVWVLRADRLIATDTAGRPILEVEVRGRCLLGAGTTRDAAWVLDVEAACFVGPDGTVRRFATPWRDPSTVATFGDALVSWNRDAADQLLVLTTDGALQSRLTGFERGDFERLVTYDGQTALVSVLRSLRRRGAADDSLDLLGCGATSGGVFAGVRIAGAAWLYTSDGEGPRPLPVGDGERVLAMTDDRVLVASRTHARWIDLADRQTGVGSDPVALDTDSYAREVQPVAWEMPTGHQSSAFSPREIVISSSGPSGMVAVQMMWTSLSSAPP